MENQNDNDAIQLLPLSNNNNGNKKRSCRMEEEEQVEVERIVINNDVNRNDAISNDKQKVIETVNVNDTNQITNSKIRSDIFEIREPNVLSSQQNHCCTVETMLTIPIEYIFREVCIPSSTTNNNNYGMEYSSSVGWSPATPRSHITTNSYINNTNNNSVSSSIKKKRTNDRAKPLLSRIEAQCFLQLNTLSYEVDALTSIAMIALERRIDNNEFSKLLQQIDNPCLRPLISMLYNYHEIIPNTTIQQISFELQNRIIPEYERLVIQIRQYSEQNWTLADTLDDTTSSVTGNDTNHGVMTYHSILAMEKRKLSDLQEEVCQRIDSMLLSFHQNDDNNNNIQSFADVSQLSMKEYCERLFMMQDQDPLVESGPNIGTGTTNNMEKVIQFEVENHNQSNREEMALKESKVRKHDTDDDEIIDDPLNNPPPTTTASPISSPEESPTFHKTAMATKNSILRNTSTTLPAGTIAMQHENDITSKSTFVIRTGDTILPQQRQLEKSFIQNLNIETIEENEKENEPSQTSSHRSVTSSSSPSRKASSQEQQHQPQQDSTSPILANATIATSQSKDTARSMDDCNDATTNVQRTILYNSNDDMDDLGDEIEYSDNDCFRTQGAAEVLSTLARTSISRTEAMEVEGKSQ